MGQGDKMSITGIWSTSLLASGTRQKPLSCWPGKGSSIPLVSSLFVHTEMVEETLHVSMTKTR